jgi:hypothetical protein
MRTRIVAYVGIALLAAALVVNFVRQMKAQSQAAFPALPGDFVVVDSTWKPLGPIIGATALGENGRGSGSGLVRCGRPCSGELAAG